MATATEPRRTLDRSDRREPVPERPRRRRRWLVWLAGTLAVATLVGWFSPAIVAHSPLLGWMAAQATASLNGQVQVGGASLAWLRPPELSHVQVVASDGSTVAELPVVAGDRPLWKVLWDSSQPGRFRIDKPVLHVVVRPDGSNLEDLLADFFEPATDEPSKPMELALQIVGATVLLEGPAGGPGTRIEQVDLDLAMPADPTLPIEIRTSGVVCDPRGDGRFDLHAKLDRTGDPAQGQSELAIQSNGVPLAALGPVLDRFSPGSQVDGRFTAGLTCRFPGLVPAGAATIEGSFRTDNLLLAAPALGTDQIRLAALEADCQAGWQDGRLQVRRLVARSDVATLSAAGTVEWNEATRQDLVGSLARQGLDVSGRVDLAKLAAVLPGTLRIREDTEITSGQLGVALSAKPGPGGTQWQGRVEAVGLTAVSSGRRFAWDQPVYATLAAHQAAEGPIVVDSLSCRSDFLNADASGTLEKLTATAQFDLGRLADQLGQFVDLGGIELAGGGRTNIQWSRSETTAAFQTTGSLELERFRLALPDRPAWTEDQLSATFSAAGQTDFTAKTRLEAASLTVNAGRDRLTAKLVGPVEGLADGGTWPVELKSSGELARWLPRISPWIVLEDWQLAGAYDLVALATGSTAALQVSQATITVGQLRVDGPYVHVAEPVAELALAGGWDRGRGRLDLPSASLNSQTLSARAENLVVALPEGGPVELTGTVTGRSDLAKLQTLTADGAEPPSVQLNGGLVTTAAFRQSGGVITGQIDATLANFVAAYPSGQRIQEPEIRLAGRGTYDNGTRTIRVEQAELTSGTLSGTADAGLTMGEPAANLDVEARLQYDLQTLSKLAESFLGKGVSLTGRGTAPVSYHGPADPTKARAGGSLSWQRADVYGFLVGPGNLEAALADGVLRVRPLDLAVSEGRLRMEPYVRFADARAELLVGRGKVVENVRINPEMCQHWLQYIAPAVAGVAEAQGRFSIELDGARVPLAQPSQGQFAGKMTVHSVEIGPGPLIRELAVALGRERAAKLKRESVVEFQMVDGRVYHRGLELEFPDVTVRTHGSVGLDKSLSLVAEMPIPPKWQSGGVMTAALREQTIQLPLAGTLDKPKLDQRAFDAAYKEFLDKAARNLLQDGLNEGLNRLFGPRQ